MTDQDFYPHPATDAMSPAISSILKRTQPWTRLMSIMGVVTIAFMVVAGLGAGAVGIATRNTQMGVLLFLYPLMALLYVFPTRYLLRYSSHIREFVAHGQIANLEAALDAQRAFWKFVGVMSLVGLAVTVCGVVAAIAIPLAIANR